jgi:hypothetical protein
VTGVVSVWLVQLGLEWCWSMGYSDLSMEVRFIDVQRGLFLKVME